MWFVIILIILAILEPFAVIWAINTLWNMGIDFTFWNWLAMLVLSMVILGPSRTK